MTTKPQSKPQSKPATKPGRAGARPRITIDRAHLARLELLASSAQRRMPELAERLLEELDRARIVESADMPADVITIGNAATYRDETTGREQTVVLVPPEEADIAQGRVSLLTPIGVALLGLAEGASFNWDTRQGETRQLTVTRVAPAAAAGPAPGEDAAQAVAARDLPG